MKQVIGIGATNSSRMHCNEKVGTKNITHQKVVLNITYYFKLLKQILYITALVFILKSTLPVVFGDPRNLGLLLWYFGGLCSFLFFLRRFILFTLCFGVR